MTANRNPPVGKKVPPSHVITTHNLPSQLSHLQLIVIAPIIGRFSSGEVFSAAHSTTTSCKKCSSRLLLISTIDQRCSFCVRSPFHTCASRVLHGDFPTSHSHALSQIIPVFPQARLKNNTTKTQRRALLRTMQLFTNVTKRGKIKFSSPNRR